MQRYFSKHLDNEYFVIKTEDEYHIKTVMRMQPNDKVEIVYNKELYSGVIETISPLKIKKCEKIDTVLDSKPNVILCVPLLKEQKMDYILQKATELGVNEIVPIILSRSLIKMDDKKEDKRIERWTRICKEASEQSKRLDVPNINKIHQLQDLNYDGVKVICSTTEHSKTIKQVLTSDIDNIVFVIGPEGGISPSEEEELVEKGFIRVSLGSRIMRVETVPLYIMSVINYEYME